MRRYAPIDPRRRGWDAVARNTQRTCWTVTPLLLASHRPGTIKESRSTERLVPMDQTPHRNPPAGSPGTLFYCRTSATRRWQGQGLHWMLALGQRCALISNTDEKEERCRPTSDELYSYTKFPDERPRNPRSVCRVPSVLPVPPRGNVSLLCLCSRTAYHLPLSERIPRLLTDSGRDPMPPRLGSAIQTRQVRRLLPEELAGLGAGGMGGTVTAYPGALLRLPLVEFMGEAIGRVISPLKAPKDQCRMDDQPRIQRSFSSPPPGGRLDTLDSQFHSKRPIQWVKPDLDRKQPSPSMDSLIGFVTGPTNGPDGDQQRQTIW
jgi:hypothetical protein